MCTKRDDAANWPQKEMWFDVSSECQRKGIFIIWRTKRCWAASNKTSLEVVSHSHDMALLYLISHSLLCLSTTSRISQEWCTAGWAHAVRIFACCSCNTTAVMSGKGNDLPQEENNPQNKARHKVDTDNAEEGVLTASRNIFSFTQWVGRALKHDLAFPSETYLSFACFSPLHVHRHKKWMASKYSDLTFNFQFGVHNIFMKCAEFMHGSERKDFEYRVHVSLQTCKSRWHENLCESLVILYPQSKPCFHRCHLHDERLGISMPSNTLQAVPSQTCQ